jgi:hypothetical protein
VPGDRERARQRDDREGQEGRQHRHVGSQAEDRPVGGIGNRLLLEEQLDAVGQRLEDAERPGPVGADAVLHVGDDLALQPDRDQDGHQQQGEDEHRLADDDQHDREIDPIAEEGITHRWPPRSPRSPP